MRRNRAVGLRRRTLSVESSERLLELLGPEGEVMRSLLATGRVPPGAAWVAAMREIRLRPGRGPGDAGRGRP